jgi:hypothetical protein
MHDLQLKIATAEGEGAWENELQRLFEAGSVDDIHAILHPAIEQLESDFGRMCLRTTPEGVTIAGWPELVEAIQEHEGDRITGVTLAVANEADRAFEKGQLHHPFMMLGLYTDEAYAFSTAREADLLAQIQAEDGPAWAGYDEDIEVYLDIDGLDELNTALLHHKQRHFFRDGAPEDAPLRYVEYVLGCWWRALLFQQAVASECTIHGLPGGIPVLAGTVEMRPEIVMVHGNGARTVEPQRKAEAGECAPILAADFIQVRSVEEETEPTGSHLRRRVLETGQEEEEKPKRGLLSRIFGR